MNINEKFASKAQQKLFFAKSNDPSLSKKEQKKWLKMAHEFAKKTDFDKIPEKVDEIVDTNGNIKTSKKPADINKKGITQKKTSDEVVKTAAGSMGTHGVHGTHTSLRYWAESDMSKALGYDETLGDDKPIDKAEKYMEKDLGLSDDETKERLSQMGYDENLPDDKVRLIENPKKYVEEFIESILSKKTQDNEMVNKTEAEKSKKDVHPIIKRQLYSLKNSMKSHGLKCEDILEFLKDE